MILLLVLGAMVFQAVVASGASKVTIGVVGDRADLQPALVAQGKAAGADVTVVGLSDETAARRALADGDVDGALIDGTGSSPRLLVEHTPNGTLTAGVQSAVGQVAVGRQLEQAGIARPRRCPTSASRPSTRATTRPASGPASPSSASSCSTRC